jgi:hypothetical protein
MTRPKPFLALGIWLLLTYAVQAEGTQFVLGVSPALPEAQRQVAWASTLNFIVFQMHVGDRLLVYDAGRITPIADLQVPNEPLFANAKPRLTRLGPEIAKLQKFFDSTTTSGTLDGSLTAPQFLEFAGRHLRREGEALTVVLVGEPFYHDAELAFDFGPDGSYPSDGFFILPAVESPFSTIEKAHALDGVVLHWAYTNEAIWTNDAQRQGVVRFWSLFIRNQGGTLASAAADAKVVFQRAADHLATAVVEAQIDSASKAEMIITHHQRAPMQNSVASVPSESKTEAVDVRGPRWLTEKSVPLAMKSAPRSGQVKIGLRWGDNDQEAKSIDLDLYVLPRPSAKEIFYRRNRTPEGFLWKDWLEAPSHGFETVELNGQSDLTQLGISVNFYRGHHSAASVGAVVRIWVNGEIFEAPISIPINNGNRGASPENRGRDPHWVVLDVSKILGLNP